MGIWAQLLTLILILLPAMTGLRGIQTLLVPDRDPNLEIERNPGPTLNPDKDLNPDLTDPALELAFHSSRTRDPDPTWVEMRERRLPQGRRRGVA